MQLHVALPQHNPGFCALSRNHFHYSRFRFDDDLRSKLLKVGEERSWMHEIRAHEQFRFGNNKLAAIGFRAMFFRLKQVIEIKFAFTSPIK